jgi:predicted transcriptional regulator
MNQISIQLDDETKRQMSQLAAWWGLPDVRHNTPVISRAVEQMLMIESARRNLSDSDFVGYLAEVYKPID